MIYETPSNILEQRINEALGREEEGIISDLIKLSLMKKASKDSDCLIYTELYNLLGLEKFTELISLVDGRTFTLPTKEEMKDTVITVLCYYYRNIKKMEWTEIKEKLGIQDINAVRQGIRSSQFESYLKELVEKRLK